MRGLLVLGIGLILGLSAVAHAQERRIYSDLSNGEAVLKGAVNDALRETKRILITWGVNSDPKSVALDEILMTNQKVVEVLDAEYILVRINSDQNLATAESLGIEVASLPTLTILDPFEGVVASEDFGGRSPDPARLLPFFYQWKPKPSAATKTIEKARVAAERKNKGLFILFSTSWCSYCRKLKTVMSDPEIAALIDPYVALIEVDQETLPGARELRYRLSRSSEGGVPWYAVMEPGGATVATSSGSGKNLGYPRRAASIGQFVEMIHAAAPQMTPDDRTALAAALNARINAAAPAGEDAAESAAQLTVR